MNAPARSPALASALGKAGWRLIPFMFLLYVVAYLDRVNVGFAQLQMKHDLGLSDAAYGLGSGLFFAGYFLFEVPSNILLTRVGPRRWIARIMVTWGVLSSAMMFARGELSFYALRILLGLAEAGFFPGMILYLTFWFPARERASAVARFMTAIAVAGIIGGPLSGLILQHLNGVSGWAGWQWLFLLEGIPSVVLGLVVLAILPDGPADVRWLSDDEKTALSDALRADIDARGAHHGGKDSHTLGQALRDRRVWILSLVYFTFASGLYAFSLWLPQIIKDGFQVPPAQVGYLAAIPSLLAAITMVAWGRRVDRQGNHRGSVILTTAIAGTSLLVAALSLSHPVPALCALSLAMMALYSSFGPFWTLPTAFLRGTAAAAGIAVVNSLGNLGGFASPYVIGLVKKATGGFTIGLSLVAGLLLAASLLVTLAVPRSTTGRG